MIKPTRNIDTVLLIILLSLILLFILLAFITELSDVAIFMQPAKKPIASQTSLAAQSEAAFWTTLHEGKIEKIPDVANALTEAYLQNPNDPKIAAHLGFLHLWLLTERERLKKIPPTIINHLIVARRFFHDAVELNPKDARFLGFLGDALMAEGFIFNNKKEQMEGYFSLLKAIAMWPEFNYFAGGFLMSALPKDSKEFKQGLEWQWKTLDLCARTSVDRKNPDFSPYMKLETQTGQQSACWNSQIAPFNFEAFFLNMGDMLVKAGQWEQAIIIYNNAKLDRDYQRWPYKFLLENHLKYVKENVNYFKNDNLNFTSSTPLDLNTRNNHTILFNSGYACVSCHQSK